MNPVDKATQEWREHRASIPYQCAKATELAERDIHAIEDYKSSLIAAINEKKDNTWGTERYVLEDVLHLINTCTPKK